MVTIASIRYERPIRYVRPTAWGRDWRQRWFQAVGSVHQHHQTAQLIAFYSDDRAPDVRLALQAELERRPGGVAEVIAVCRSELRRFNRGEVA